MNKHNIHSSLLWAALNFSAHGESGIENKLLCEVLKIRVSEFAILSVIDWVPWILDKKKGANF
jgi:hypothetical protein